MNKVVVEIELFDGNDSRGVVRIDSSKGPNIEVRATMFPSDLDLVSRIVDEIVRRRDRFPVAKKQCEDHDLGRGAKISAPMIDEP